MRRAQGVAEAYAQRRTSASIALHDLCPWIARGLPSVCCTSSTGSAIHQSARRTNNRHESNRGGCLRSPFGSEVRFRLMPVPVNKNTPFVQAFALQSSSNNLNIPLIWGFESLSSHASSSLEEGLRAYLPTFLRSGFRSSHVSESLSPHVSEISRFQSSSQSLVFADTDVSIEFEDTCLHASALCPARQSSPRRDVDLFRLLDIQLIKHTIHSTIHLTNLLIILNLTTCGPQERSPTSTGLALIMFGPGCQ